nr:MAG TPA: Glycine radical [Bacteriophage sp.]
MFYHMEFSHNSIQFTNALFIRVCGFTAYCKLFAKVRFNE